METNIEEMTPYKAELILNSNTSNNRNIRPTAVNHLANEIINGRWQLTHQGIAIDENGMLIDGQHRLTAIIKAQITVPIMVTTGVPSRNFDVIDNGQPRSISDITGKKRKDCEIAVIFNAVLNGGTSVTVRKASPEVVLTILSEFQEIELFHKMYGTNIKNISPASMRLAAIIFSMNSNDNYSLSLYSDLLKLKQDTGHPIVGAFYRNLITGKLKGMNKTELACYSFSLFDEKKKNNKVIVPVKQENMREIIITTLSKNLLNKGSSIEELMKKI